jgi:hypothetical protein
MKEEKYCPDCFRRCERSAKYKNSFYCPSCQDLFSESIMLSSREIKKMKGGNANNGQQTKV